MSAPGKVLFLLHAHLPFVRHPEHSRFFEENWFFEALSETEQDAKALGDSINLTDETINKQNDLINAQNINQDKDIDEIIKANSNAVNSSDFNLNNE